MQNVTHFLCFNRLEYRIRTQVQKFDFHFLYSVLGKEGGPGGQRPCLGHWRTVHQCAPALMSFNLQEKVTTKRETVLPLYSLLLCKISNLRQKSWKQQHSELKPTQWVKILKKYLFFFSLFFRKV